MNGKQIVFAVIGTVTKVVMAAVLLMFLYRYAIAAYDCGYRLFAEPAMDKEPGREVSLTVSENDTTEDIGWKMEQKGLIRDAWLYRVHEKLSDLEGGIAPGTYELNTAMTVEEMVELMVTRTQESSAAAEE